MENDSIQLPTLGSIQKILEPIYSKLERIEKVIQIKQSNINSDGKYYRNQDLKRIFGLSSNTIIKYRDTGILPYTRIGDVYLYEIKAIQQILQKNKVV